MAAKRGRPPKPPELRIADGTHIKLRHGPAFAIGAEKKLTAIPKVPNNKGKEFKTHWRVYCDGLLGAGVLSERDIPVITQLCDVHQLLADTLEILGDADQHYITDDHGIKRHPALTTVERCRNYIASQHLILGFGPSGRAKVPPMVDGAKSTGVQTMNRKA